MIASPPKSLGSHGQFIQLFFLAGIVKREPSVTPLRNTCCSNVARGSEKTLYFIAFMEGERYLDYWDSPDLWTTKQIM